jgi:SAM-dependent methyltransferase
MDGKQLVSTVKYVASARPAFMLSEIALYLDESVTADQMYVALLPHLDTLCLEMTKTSGDYEVRRIVPAPPYALNAAEEERVSEYLGCRSFPPALDEAIAGYIEKKTGKELSDPVVLERLRHAIVAQKDDYWKPTDRRSLQYTKGYSVLGYLAYHFPVYFMQTRHLLAQLARDGLLKQEMTVLDLGSGPGVVPLAIADFWQHLDSAKAEVRSVERSKEHIEAFGYLAGHTGVSGSRVTLHPPIEADITDTENPSLPRQADLIVFSNVLNELAGLSVEKRAEVVMGYARHLAPDGTILIVEPAEEVTSTGLRVLSLALKKKGLTIYAPCTFVWGTNCTPDRCWSFTTAPPIRPTRVMGALAACNEPFRYVNTDIKYSYVMLRKDGKTRQSCHISRDTRAIRLSKVHLNAGKKITVIAAKMSGDLGDDKTHVFRICDGSAEKPVFAVLPRFHAGPENEAVLSAGYGDLLVFGNVQVRYNPDHDAYNLFVTRDSPITLLV